MDAEIMYLAVNRAAGILEESVVPFAKQIAAVQTHYMHIALHYNQIKEARDAAQSVHTDKSA